MNTLYFLKTIRILIMMALTANLILAPLTVSIDGNFVPIIKYQRASALANVGILDNQQLNGSYNPSTGYLSLVITGTPLLSLGVLNTETFVYQLPAELRFVLDDPRFQQNASIYFEENWLLGSTSDTISGSSLTLNSTDGTITGQRNSALNISLGATVTVTLTINLSALGVAKLPPSPDGKLEFYGLAATDAPIDLTILVSEGASYVMGTDVLPPPPTVNPVSDVDTVITGTGQAGATVKLVTPSGNYEGLVDTGGSYSITIPAQDAGTVITATQTVAGIESNGVSITVIGVILEFTVPSEIQFQNTPIKPQEITIPRVVPNWSITVRDTRGQGSRWIITAKVTGPLTSTDGDNLDPNALVFVNGNSVESLNNQVLIYEGTTGVDQKTTIQWNENEGILIKLTPTGLFNAQTGVTYSTTIHWTLENAP